MLAALTLSTISLSREACSVGYNTLASHPVAPLPPERLHRKDVIITEIEIHRGGVWASFSRRADVLS